MSIGYACLTIGVPGSDLSGCILKNASMDRLKEITASNLAALDKMIDYNIRNHIQLFRISSDIIPFGSHPVNQFCWWEEYQDTLSELGKKMRVNNIRASMHPGQYTVLNSPDNRVVSNALEELKYHDRFLTALGMNETNKLILHIGGLYGDKDKAIAAFIMNYSGLVDPLKRRLVIENDDKIYNIEDVLYISDKTGAPVVFDNLHHVCNPPQDYLSEGEWLIHCGKTWKKRDGTQKTHYSQQKAEAKRGSHSDTISLPEFMDYYNTLPDKDIDIMLEVKDKNLSAVKCRNVIMGSQSEKDLAMEWDRYQLQVLSRSEMLYNQIEAYLKNEKALEAEEFYGLIDQALQLPENKVLENHAAKRVWNYLQSDSTTVERNRYEKLIRAYSAGNAPAISVRRHLFQGVQRRKIEYLMNSLYFYI